MNILQWWHARTRRMDIDLLWPACKREAENLDQARAVFAVHAFNDPGWLELGEDEIKRQIGELE
jgi:hypothetical protein